MFGLMTMAGSLSALLHFTLTTPCHTFRTYWLMKTCSLQKQVECIYIVCYLIARHVSVSVLVLNCHLFLVSPGAKFPTGFVFMVQKVFLLLFRTMAHIYWSHYTQAQQVGLHPHLNTLFMHLTLFCRHHELLDPEDTEPLQDLITALGRQGWT